MITLEGPGASPACSVLQAIFSKAYDEYNVRNANSLRPRKHALSYDNTGRQIEFTVPQSFSHDFVTYTNAVADQIKTQPELVKQYKDAQEVICSIGKDDPVEIQIGFKAATAEHKAHFVLYSIETPLPLAGRLMKAMGNTSAVTRVEKVQGEKTVAIPMGQPYTKAALEEIAEYINEGRSRFREQDADYFYGDDEAPLDFGQNSTDQWSASIKRTRPKKRRR